MIELVTHASLEDRYVLRTDDIPELVRGKGAKDDGERP